VLHTVRNGLETLTKGLGAEVDETL
jgi:hypothetical protein